MTTIQFLAEWALRSSILIVSGALLLWALRVKDPSIRWAAWTAMLCASLAIPALTVTLPKLPLVVMRVAPVRVEAPPVVYDAPLQPMRVVPPSEVGVERHVTPVSKPFDWARAAVMVYVLVALGLLLRLCFGLAMSLRLLRRSRVAGQATEGIEIRESNRVATPVALGIARSTIVLPSDWREWDGAKLDVVLAHERSHIRRHDPAVQLLSAIHRALLWHSPLSWFLHRRIVRAAEEASDDAALAVTGDRALYAQMLLDFMQRGVRGASWQGVLPMARYGRADKRIHRILDGTVLSRGVTRWSFAAILALGLPLAYLVAAAHPQSAGYASPPRTAAPETAKKGQTHLGKLKPELVPNSTLGQTEPMEPVTPQDRAALPVTLAPEDRVFTGGTFFRKRGDIKLALVEPAKGDAYLFADVNQNGAFERDERFLFEGPKREVLLKLPLSAGPYRYYPIRLFIPQSNMYMSDNSGKANGGGRTLLRSPYVFVEGTVDIRGQKTLVRYMFDMDKGGAYPDWGWQGMDTNGDGRIDERANSDEWTFAKDEIVVFHVNGRDVSTLSLDLKSGTFVVRERPAGDNQRILLRVGDQVPDFSFTDLDGKPHRFSEFHGKYVLLDFWGTWCAPCRRELPDLEKAYQQFRPRGFVILGMGDDKKTDKARKVISAAGVTYPQSSGETGNDLVYKRFRVDKFPTKALVDPEGKIIALDSDGSFDRERIRLTLDKLLPHAQ